MNKITPILHDGAQAVISFMPYLNGVLGLVIVGYILQRLFCHAGQYTHAERVGMGTVAGGILMSTPALWIQNTPFDGWSFNVARFGIVLYIITGGMRRDRHAKKNAELRAQAEQWRRDREGSK